MRLLRLASLAVALGAMATTNALGTLIDDFSDASLAEYTSTVILDANGGGSNVAAWQSPSGTLELVTSEYEGIEQYAFIRSGLSLAVGEEVQVDLAHSGASQDLGLYVGGTTPVTGTRQDYVAMYARGNGQVFSRGFDGGSEYPLAGGGTPAYESLFIARVDTNTYEAGYYEGGVRNILATRTPSFANDADVVGFYADVRAAGTLGGLDNLRVIPEPASMVLAGFGVVGLLAWRRRRT